MNENELNNEVIDNNTDNSLYKTKVLLNEAMVKKYYNNIFIKYSLFLEIVMLVSGSTGAGMYIVNDAILNGVAVEVITIFMVLVVYFINRNNRKIALTALAEKEKEFNIEFDEKVMRIHYHKEIKEISYSMLKIVRLKDFYQFRSRAKGDTLIYIIPRDNYETKEWNEIFTLIKRKGEQ